MSTAPIAPAPSPHPQLQAVRNLQLLARQAIGNQFPTMSVDPKMVADACIALDAVLSGNVPGVPVDERVRSLTAELAAAQANVESLASQAERRYQDGIREGAQALGPAADKLAATAARIARERMGISVTDAVTDAKAELARG
jgi:hypothetical protein